MRAVWVSAGEAAGEGSVGQAPGRAEAAGEGSSVWGKRPGGSW